MKHTDDTKVKLVNNCYDRSGEVVVLRSCISEARRYSKRWWLGRIPWDSMNPHGYENLNLPCRPLGRED